jgi:hypothetical protein
LIRSNVGKKKRRNLLPASRDKLLLFLFWDAADGKAIPAVVVAIADADNGNAQSVSSGVVLVVLSTAPIVAERACVADLTGVVEAAVWGRKKKGFSGGFVGKQSAVYAI